MFTGEVEVSLEIKKKMSFFFIEISLTYKIVLTLGVQHDFIYAYIENDYNNKLTSLSIRSYNFFFFS